MNWDAAGTIAVVGATGVVGRTMIQVLTERGFPAERLRLLASARSAGSTIGVGDVEVPVAECTADTLQGIDIALFSAGGDASREWAPRCAETGAIVVDNSSAFRRDPNVPLVVPEVNPEAALTHRGIIANPNCSTIQAVVPLAPLAAEFGLKRVACTSYQAVSGAGQAALQELAGADPSVFPTVISGNVIPAIGAFDDDGNSVEENKMVAETRKILNLPTLPVTATCVRVPVHTGHCVAVNVETERAVTAAEAREVLDAAAGISLAGQQAWAGYATPLEMVGRDDVSVGRIRVDESLPHGLHLWTVADNLRKGAASNAVQIAEVLINAR